MLDAVSSIPLAADDLVEIEVSIPPAPEPPKRKLRLGEVLVLHGVVDDEAVGRALAVQKMGGGRLGSILVNLKLCTEEQIREALGKQMGVEVVDLKDVEPDRDVLDALPIELVKKYEAVPVRRVGETLHVAMMDPYNLTAIDDIRFCTGARKLVIMTCAESDFRSFVEEHLATQCLIEEILQGGDFYQRAVESVDSNQEEEELPDDERADIIHDLRLAGEQPPVITLCNFLLVEAIRRRASDIHVEPYETYFRIRLRIDGRLHTLLTPPQRLHTPMIARLKIMSEMDISKRRIPQDGHIAIVHAGETVHYRVSTLPTVYGEKCVVRLLKKDKSLTTIDRIGFSPPQLKRVRKALRSPQGLILVTGPTGSGKTTTLHAGLADINDPDTNIVTLEDPVEASIPGINHVQINDKQGLSFSAGLRSILRQDPDVVFVGEMRDPEVSKIAIKAALTGHLVLSTLHTNGAAESLVRLTDMQVPGFLLANSLLMIIAQRLVRRVCKRCATSYTPTEDEIAEFRLTEAQLSEAKMAVGEGCSECMGSGFRGRLAVYEILNTNTEIRSLIRAGAETETVVIAARKNGMQLLFDEGIEKALAGHTTLDELRRTLSDTR